MKTSKQSYSSKKFETTSVFAGFDICTQQRHSSLQLMVHWITSAWSHPDSNQIGRVKILFKISLAFKTISSQGIVTQSAALSEHIATLNASLEIYVMFWMYDTFSVVVECWVSFWSDFQNGSRVLKKVL